MSYVSLSNMGLNNQLQQLLEQDTIEWGTNAGYQLAKDVFLYHPLGYRIAAGPLKLAMSKQREIKFARGPEVMLREAFEREWKALSCDDHIFATMTQSRVYGVAAMVIGARGHPTDVPIDPWKLQDLDIFVHTFDALNLAGSMVLNQNPNAIDFQGKTDGITGAGQPYARANSLVMLNEFPVYLAFNSAGFGFNGRSVYQRAIYPLRSYLLVMQTDAMVARKAGLIVAKIKQAGSIVSNMMAKATGYKRSILQQGGTDNILSIDTDEDIEAIDLNNVNEALTASRRNILEDIAAAVDMPARYLTQETMSTGMAEGTEDAAELMRYISDIRKQTEPLYEKLTKVVAHRAWTREFFDACQNEYPETYGNVTYEAAFYDWFNGMSFVWPDLNEEKASDAVKVDEIKLKGMTEILRTLLPIADPENRARMFQWAQDNLNEMGTMFAQDMELDIESMQTFVPPDEAESKLPAAR
jgi:hypothetical protein